MRPSYSCCSNCSGFVSVPAIGIWGLRPTQQALTGKYLLSFSPGDRDLGFASLFFSYGLHRPHRVSVPAIGIWGLRHNTDPGTRTLQGTVSVPAIGIWGLRLYRTFTAIGLPTVSVPAIGIWGLRRPMTRSIVRSSDAFQSRRSGFGVCVPLPALWKFSRPKRFSPGDRDLGFASGTMWNEPRSGAAVSVPAIGIWGLRPLRIWLQSQH